MNSSASPLNRQAVAVVLEVAVHLTGNGWLRFRLVGDGAARAEPERWAGGLGCATQRPVSTSADRRMAGGDAGGRRHSPCRAATRGGRFGCPRSSATFLPLVGRACHGRSGD